MDLSQTTAVILAGGMGTRLGDAAGELPKPMVDVGGIPILLRIMDSYSRHGVNRFLVLGGYRVSKIKEFFALMNQTLPDIKVNLATGQVTPLKPGLERRYEVTIIDTGLNTMTGGRLLRAKSHLPESPFFLTYGDGLSDIDFSHQMAFHLNHGKIGTVTAVSPQSKFGNLKVGAEGIVNEFSEKPRDVSQQISGGFFVFSPEIFSFLESDEDTLEERPLKELARCEELIAYPHTGFWACMDTPKDLSLLREVVTSQGIREQK